MTDSYLLHVNEYVKYGTYGTMNNEERTKERKHEWSWKSCCLRDSNNKQLLGSASNIIHGPQLAQIFSVILILLICWGIAFTLLGTTAAPSGQLFNLILLVTVAYCVGWLFLKITSLPALIGMLLTGIAWQNLGLIQIERDYMRLTSDLRKIALVIILSRAGLGLDMPTMRKHYAIVLKLGLLPWFVECTAIALVTHFLLDLPWIWGFLLGSMIASVSPAVVVPCLFRLREQGYGVDKGIPTIILAAAGIDDSISVSIFGIIHSAIFSMSSLTITVLQGPVSIVAGIGFGILWGTLLKYIPHKNDVYMAPLRFLLLFGGGLLVVFGSNLIGWGGAGPLAVVSAGFIAALHWSNQGWPVNDNPVSHTFRIFWLIFEPILFAFTGAQIKIKELDPTILQLGTACLLACVILRLLSTILVGYKSILNNKEKFFIGITWLAKATVQAALGSVALDSVVANPYSPPEDFHRASVILTISILSIILTAPLGAILIAVLGPRLLEKQIKNTETLPDLNETRGDVTIF